MVCEGLGVLEVYCDESRPEVMYGEKDKDKFMIIGGIWVPNYLREEVKSGIKFLKKQFDLNGEFKWNKVSPSKINFYVALIDLFFNFPVRFRCIVVDGSNVDIDTYHESDSELGFYKFYYQLLYHWIDPKEKYWIYLDYKKNKLPNRLHDLERVLKNKTSAEIFDVQAIESKQSVFIQLTDVLIGAVGYRMNEHNQSLAKLKIVNRIEHHLNHPIEPTPKGEWKFNVFKIDLRGRS